MTDLTPGQETGSSRPQWASPLLVGGLLLLAALGLYSVSMQGPPQFDDVGTFQSLPGGRLAEFPRRAVAQFTFFMSYRLHGTNPFGYHLVNVLLHVLTALGVFFLVRTCNQSKKGTIQAYLAAWIFLCHPLATQAVTYMSQRYTCLAAAFAVWSAWCIARGRRAAEDTGSLTGLGPLLWLAGGTILAIAAVFSKEYVAGLPILILAADSLFFRNSRFRWRERLIYLTPILATLIIVPAVYLYMTSDVGLETEATATLLPNWSGGVVPRKVYFLTQWKIILGTYFRLMLCPVGQSIDHGFSPADSILEPGVLISGLILSAVLIGGLSLWRRLPLVSFGILLIYFGLAPTSTVVQNSEFVAEHRSYLSLIGFALIAARGLSALRGKWRLGIALVYCLALSGLTIQRNRLWTDELALWQDAIAKAPDIPRPYFAVGEAFRRRGESELALDYYEKALAVRPRYYGALLNRAVVLETAGKQKAAMEAYRELLTKYPEDPPAMKNLAFLFSRMDRPAKAQIVWERYLGRHPKDAQAHFFLGQAVESMGRETAARKAYRQALAFGASGNLAFACRVKLGRLALATGDPAVASRHLQAAHELRPAAPLVNLFLADALLRQNEFGAAEGILRNLLPRLQAKNLARAHWLLAKCLDQQGDADGAAENRQRALRLDPEIGHPPETREEQVPTP